MTLEEDAGIQRTNPRHRRSTRQKGKNGVVPSSIRLLVLGVLTTWEGEWGPLRGKWGLSSPFSLFFSACFPLPLIHTQNPVFQIPLPLTIQLLFPTPRLAFTLRVTGLHTSETDAVLVLHTKASTRAFEAESMASWLCHSLWCPWNFIMPFKSHFPIHEMGMM